jgi:uncharacterized protein YjbI with pentapeptide repeats
MADQRHLNKLNEGVSAWNRWREDHPEILPDLRKADLSECTLAEINFRRTNLDGAKLHNANLRSASLDFADLTRADLSGAKLHHARLHRTCFRETILQRTNFHEAYLLNTEFLNVDFSETLNLQTAFHPGSSTIAINTIQRSIGKSSDAFLHGAGVSEQLLTCIRSSGRALDYFTCFISYASEDHHFVNILYQDLCNAGVRCWFAPESLKAGEKFPTIITEAVQSHEKVLVVLSKHSLKSDWVRCEVELARQKEGNGRRDVLMPIYLDRAYTSTTVNWAVAIGKKRHFRPFENWQQPPVYQKACNRLLNDLRKE